MLWILMLFAVGVCGALGFYDKALRFNDQIRYINSGILVLLSLGLLFRTWLKTKQARFEKLMKRNAELEQSLGTSNSSRQTEKPEAVSAGN